MNWPLVRRGVFRYSLLAAGTTVAVPVGLFGSAAAVATFVAGLLTMLWVSAGGGNVRTATAVSNADSMGVAGSVRDPGENTPAAVPSDVRVFFYGIGLLAWSPVAVAATVLVG